LPISSNIPNENYSHTLLCNSLNTYYPPLAIGK
jgi:hypothetical protein